MNIPPQLLDSLTGVPGFDQQEFVAAHQQAPPVSIRLNAIKVSIDHPAITSGHLSIGEKVPWTSTGYYLSERPVFTLDPTIHAGGYYVQEASSMFIEYLLAQLLGDQRGLKVIDLCAAPGGKTTLLAGMPQFSLVLANEIIKSRVSILHENATKWGDPKIFISNSDPSEFAGLPGYFDVMVVDAPCSGSGLFRKDEQALNEWSVAGVQHCAERQKRILLDALPALKENGLLIYSTCSYSPQEDEEILDFLLDQAVLSHWTCKFLRNGVLFHPDQRAALPGIDSSLEK